MEVILLVDEFVQYHPPLSSFQKQRFTFGLKNCKFYPKYPLSTFIARLIFLGTTKNLCSNAQTIMMDNDLQETPRRRLDFDQDEDVINRLGDEDSLELLHSQISKESIPRVGMEFETEEAAYKFYNAYARNVGFSIRRSIAHKEKDRVLDRVFVCSCQGKKGSDKRDNVYKYQPRAHTRFDCKAMLKVNSRQTGRFCVVHFRAEHNHNLASPSKAHLFRSHRKILASQAVEVDLAEISGIAPKNGFELMARKAGGRENLGFDEVDYSNYLRDKRKMKASDTSGVLEFLRGKKAEEPTFYSDIQVDEDGLITNIFWADVRMIVDYDYFGDVVCFDTTYRKHKDSRPIALFVGVNHHKQSIVFGAALLYEESTESFVWLFDTFSKAMGGKLPKTMLTDQDAAMSKALAIQWPETYHRLCIWHIFQNAATHLSSIFAKDKEFSRAFSSCIYDYEYEQDFLDAWYTMLDKYELQNNDWLKRMFNIKKKWALVYGRDTFCGDMTTTQRSESMNNVIKHYVGQKDDLSKFFENFQRLLDDRRNGEMVADFKACQREISLPFPVALLKHASSVYTPAIYKLFQEELCKAYDCVLEGCREIGAVLEYTVSETRLKKFTFVVSYDSKEEKFCCACRKFEFAGLLCCHVLKVFSFRGTSKVPDKYILRRWSKNAKRGSVSATSVSPNVEIDPKTLMGRRYRELCRLSTQLVTQAAKSDDGYMLVKKAFLNLMNETDSSSTKRPMQSTVQNNHIAASSQNVDMPLDVNGKMEEVRGIKKKLKPKDQKKKRPKGALEKATKRKKKLEHTDQHTTPIPQVNQSVHMNEIPPQHPSSFSSPWDPCGYFTPLESVECDMYTNPLLAQPTQESLQPSYMALLTSSLETDL